jgi:hypothetical protein
VILSVLSLGVLAYAILSSAVIPALSASFAAVFLVWLLIWLSPGNHETVASDKMASSWRNMWAQLGSNQ